MAAHYDAIVLGAGPAGLTAGIYLARARIKTLIVDEGIPGGQMITSYEVANYPGIAETSGAQIARAMVNQAKSFGCEILSQTEVVRYDFSGPLKEIEVEDEGVFTSKAIIIATGGLPRSLGLPSEALFKGKGISYCATCDGDFFTGKEIVAIGGGNAALEEAVSLAKYADKVTVIHEFDQFQAQPWAVDEAKKHPKIHFLMNQEVRGFEGKGRLEKVVTADKKTGEVTELPSEGCFIFIGYKPNTKQFSGLVTLNERGEIVTDDDMKTDVPGVFAAGDNRAKRYRQITTAVADGTIAALSVAEYIQSGAFVRQIAS